MYNNVFNFMNEKELIYKYQIGFRQKHSTQQAIITLVDKSTKRLDSGDILKWFGSYLTNRSQFIMYDNIQSETRSIKSGVPQGSILGPLLFIIYMNDICNVSDLLYTIMYADDTSVIMRGNNLESLIQSVNSELYLIFHRARIKVDNDNSIRMNDSIINSVSHLKCLGVIINSKLNWIPHITYVKNKISKGIGIMFKVRDYLKKMFVKLVPYLYISISHLLH